MKRASLFAAALPLAASPVAAADLTLTLSTRASGGRIAIAVYRDADSMRRGEGAVRTALIPRTGGITTTALGGLAPRPLCRRGLP